MKFKAFRIKTHNKHLNKACIKHAKAIGGNHYDEDKDFLGELFFTAKSDFSVSENGTAIEPEITLDEFFSLTAESVKVKPKTEMKEYIFRACGKSETMSCQRLTKEEAWDVASLIEKMVAEREA